MNKISGREEEITLLDELLKSPTADLLAVYGRRRVGKTYLIQTYLEKQIVFHVTGMYQSPLKDQLQQFSIAIQEAAQSTLQLKPPTSWIEAFQMLKDFLIPLPKSRKMVIFLDELPWLDGRKSGFLRSFEHFWNNWASLQPHLLIIICGSSASWMVNNVINNKGGLHNRITAKMPLEPFSLSETEAFLKSLGCKLDRYQLLQIYMAFGGIPHYLKTVGRDRSAAQVIERTCFSKQGLLTGEFDNLYNSLFELADNHIKIVRALAKNSQGLTRKEIIKKCGLSSGGRATKIMDELERSGFIQQRLQFGNASKNAVYRLIDEFSIFYLKFMDNRPPGGKNVWAKISSEPSYIIWCGIAFEAVCLKHVEQIISGLKIQKRSTVSTWKYNFSKGSKQRGAQIDLIIDRNDHIINLCELKFCQKKFTIDKKYAEELKYKMELFDEIEAPHKTLFLTMVTTYGLTDNQYADQIVQQELNMNTLFKDV